MYLPKHFEETRVPVLHELIHAHPLGALVVLTPSGPAANQAAAAMADLVRRSRSE